MNVSKTDDSSGGENQTTNDGSTTDPAIETLRLANENLEKKLADQLKASQETTRKLQEFERQKLEGSGDFRKLYEDERKLREESEAKTNRLSTGFMLAAKQNAGREALRKAGMSEEAMKLVASTQFESLAADVEETGEIKVSGTETFVDDFKKKFPTLFGRPAPNVNSGGGSPSTNFDGKVMNAAEFLKIEKTHGPRSKEAQEAWAKLQTQKKQK